MTQSCSHESNQACREMLQNAPISLSADDFSEFPPQIAFFSSYEQKRISYKSTYLTCIICMALLWIFQVDFFF